MNILEKINMKKRLDSLEGNEPILLLLDKASDMKYFLLLILDNDTKLSLSL